MGKLIAAPLRDLRVALVIRDSFSESWRQAVLLNLPLFALALFMAGSLLADYLGTTMWLLCGGGFVTANLWKLLYVFVVLPATKWPHLSWRQRAKFMLHYQKLPSEDLRDRHLLEN